MKQSQLEDIRISGGEKVHENQITIVKISEKIPEESTQIYIHTKTTTKKHTIKLTTWVEN